MRAQGTLRSHELARDGRADKVDYGLLREEWTALASATASGAAG